jgi:hypothetical protein
MELQVWPPDCVVHSSFSHSVFLLDYFLLPFNYFQELSTQLLTVYELILQLKFLEEELHARSLSELQALVRHEERGKLGQFGKSTHEEELHHKRSLDFKQKYIPGVQTQLRILSKSYQVKYFLNGINSSSVNRILFSLLHNNDLFSVKIHEETIQH